MLETITSVILTFNEAANISRTLERLSWGRNIVVVDSERILALDADHVVTDELIEEIGGLCPQKNICGYRVQFIYCVPGQKLRGSLYPPLISLYRRGHADYVQQGHTQR